MKRKLAALMAVVMALTVTVLPAAALSVEDGKQLLETYYVDPLPQGVDRAENLEELVEALHDPYTVYFSREEYQQFLDDVNGERVCGIGVQIKMEFENGFPILSILPHSPALEAGLKAGDRIVAVDGTELTAGSDPRTLISGPEGSRVTITVIHEGGSREELVLSRREVSVPIVTYELVGDAGYINCASFGESTAATVFEAVKELDGEAAAWVLDLRSNPGGTADAAAGTACVFTEETLMTLFRNGAGEYTAVRPEHPYPDVTDKPLIILSSPHSASGSELFMGAARDHGFGISLGQRSYGKGVAQIILDESNTNGMFQGDSLKVTAYRFYSPAGVANHVIGVLPTLAISEENTPAAALLLSAPAPKHPDGEAKLEIAGQTFYVDLDEAQQEPYRGAFGELLEALPPAAQLYLGSGSYWVPVSGAEAARRLELDFRSRSFSDLEDSPYRREIDTLAAYQLLDGYEDGSFRPQAPVSRAEFAAMTATALQLTVPEELDFFPDVREDQWFCESVSAMAARGFLHGYEDGSFRPDAPITYQEVLTVLAAVAAWTGIKGYELTQKDMTVNDLAAYGQYPEWIRKPLRTMNGLDAVLEEVPLDRPASREVAAATLCRLMENAGLIWD